MQPQPFETLAIAIDCLTAHPDWYLFPISRLEKFPPCFDNNLALASNDPAQIKKWFTMYPGCNWGISLKKSKLIVVDVDTKEGKDGQESLDTLELERGPLPETLTVRTPSGGLHYYFNEANGVTHQMRLNAFGKDIDSTNYVLVPGCWLVASNEQNYETITDVPVADAPEWFGEYLGDRVIEKVEQTPAVDLDTDDIVDHAIYFLKNDAKPSIQFKNGEFTLLMTAAVLKDMGISQTTAIDLLATYYNERCEPMWSIGDDGAQEDRLDIKVSNAWTYLNEVQPGALSPQAEFGTSEASIDADDINLMAQIAANTGYTKDQAEELKKAREAKARKEKPKEPKPESEIKKATREEFKAVLSNPEPKVADVRDTLMEDLGVEKPEEAELRVPVVAINILPLSPFDKIDESTIAGSISEVCRRWVWVTGLKRFVNRRDPGVQWDTKQFDSQFNQFAEKSSVSNDLFKNGQLLRRFRNLTFVPGGDEVVGVGYNVWRPSPIKPVEGNTDIWDKHINTLFQNEEDQKMVLDWMAFVLQNPKLKPNHALLVVGRQTGTGKSLLASIFEQLIGVRHTSRPKNSSMGGDFNSWLMNCRLCILEEVYQPGRRENLNAMRDLITEKRVEVNMKGVPAFTLDNYVAMMGVSNHPDALPLDDFDRRWLVIETFATPQDESYYAPLFALLEDSKALGAIYYQLMQRDLTGYSALSRAPKTDARVQMIEMSRTDEETWLFENAEKMPLRRNVLRVEDIVDAMPSQLQKARRLMTNTIPNFLRDRLKGVRHSAQSRLANGDKVRLWVLHGRYEMVKNEDLGALYEKERTTSGKEMDDVSTAKGDFEES